MWSRGYVSFNMVDKEVPSLISWRLYGNFFYFLWATTSLKGKCALKIQKWSNQTFREKIENPQKCFYKN